MSHRLQPAPGICLVLPTPISNSELNLGLQSQGHITTGRVLSCGDDVTTDSGEKIKSPCREGDIIYFLRYENGYDECVIDGVVHVWSLFKDIRGIIVQEKNEN